MRRLWLPPWRPGRWPLTTARRQGVVESFLQEFSLSTREGLALMCLAIALLRYAVERAVSVNIAAHGGDPALLHLNP